MKRDWWENGNARRSVRAFERLKDTPPDHVAKGNREVERWRWWSRRVATDFIRDHRHKLRGIVYAEVYAASAYGMVKAARLWREEDGAFSGYSWYFMRKEMQNLLQEHRRHGQLVGLMEDHRGNVVASGGDGGEGERRVLAGEIMSIVETFPHPFPRVVRDFMEGVQQVETAAALGVGVRRVRGWRDLAFAWVRHLTGEGPEPDGNMEKRARRWAGSGGGHRGAERKLA